MDKLSRARKLEAEARALRKQAFDESPLPDFWRVGQKVRYIRSDDYGYKVAGETAYVQRLDDGPQPRAEEYQVFWTGPKRGTPTLWTTPLDVELVEDVPA